MGSPRIIQTPELLNERVVEQLRQRKVDSGQYFGGQITAARWATLAHHHPMKDIAALPLDGEGAVTVLDLGPGSGKPCLAAIGPFLDRVRSVVCVDTSTEMAEQAAEAIRSATGKPVECIVADFLRDAIPLRRALNADTGRKLFLCLGGTAGNFRQKHALATLRSLLATDDRLLLGLGLYDPSNPDQELAALSAFFTSETNCAFGLSFLTACGGVADHQQAFARHGDDPDELGVRVVRAFYRFPADTVLRVGSESVPFKAGDDLQYVESRRYPRSAVADYLLRHGLEVVASQEFDRHGLYLCK